MENKNKHTLFVRTDFYNNHKQPIFQCTSCMKEIGTDEIKKFKYCPFCGKKIREVKYENA